MKYIQKPRSLGKRLVPALVSLFVFCFVLIDLTAYTYFSQEKQNQSVNHDFRPSIEFDISFARRYKTVDFRIIVITFNRPWSLLRLLTSLNAVDYMEDIVVIEVWLDRSKSGVVDDISYATANNFSFEKGRISVFNHTQHVGIYGQWMGLWRPSYDTKENVVILEDDVTVSPFFYRYLKTVHKKYRKDDRINGFALQCSIKHSGASGNLHAPDENVVFLYPIIGTWGFSPKISNWVNFTRWYRKASNIYNFEPLVPGIVPTVWYEGLKREGRADSMWEIWHIYFAWTRHELTLYPNFKRCDGMSINWKEIGLHYKSKGKVTDQLITYWDNRLNELPYNPVQLNANGELVR